MKLNPGSWGNYAREPCAWETFWRIISTFLSLDTNNMLSDICSDSPALKVSGQPLGGQWRSFTCECTILPFLKTLWTDHRFFSHTVVYILWVSHLCLHVLFCVSGYLVYFAAYVSLLVNFIFDCFKTFV